MNAVNTFILNQLLKTFVVYQNPPRPDHETYRDTPPREGILRSLKTRVYNPLPGGVREAGGGADIGGKRFLQPALFAIVFCFLPLLPIKAQILDALSDIGAEIGKQTGALTPEQAGSIKKAGSAIGKTFESITPEQEYYIGRTVGAVIINKYRPYDNEAANHYLNVLGQTLAQFSDRPETFGGYHFLLMDSSEINAFSAPGGLIFISRGMLNCCKNEDALAAVLAHEIGHVEHQHGLQAIQKSRLNSAFTILAAESAKQFGGQDLKDLTTAFEGSINDITATMMNSGYARSCEKEADKSAVEIMKRAGYDPNGLTAMLMEMKKQLKPDGLDFAKTHPSPDARIADITRWIGPYQPVTMPVQRQVRFERNAKLK